MDAKNARPTRIRKWTRESSATNRLSEIVPVGGRFRRYHAIVLEIVTHDAVRCTIFTVPYGRLFTVSLSLLLITNKGDSLLLILMGFRRRSQVNHYFLPNFPDHIMQTLCIVGQLKAIVLEHLTRGKSLVPCDRNKERNRSHLTISAEQFTRSSVIILSRITIYPPPGFNPALYLLIDSRNPERNSSPERDDKQPRSDVK